MAKHQPAEVRREQIFQAALEVCAAQGYRETRILDIAERAALSKGSIYHHFRSKDDLFLALLERTVGELRQMLTVAERAESTIEALRETFGAMISMLQSNPELMHAVLEFYNLSVRKAEFKECFRGYYESLIQAFAAVIRRGIERGEIDPDIDPERAAAVLCMGGDGLATVVSVLGRDDDIDLGILREFMFLFLRSLTRRQP